MKPIMALDADGVMLDYNLAYARAWERHFGETLIELDPHAYWAIDRFNARHLEGDELKGFETAFDEEFWTTVPMLTGVFEACDILHRDGYEIVCVSAISDVHRVFREQNLKSHGLPIDRVIAAGVGHGSRHRINQKAPFLAELKPVAFVDDYLPYFKGVPTGIHKALIMRANDKNHPNKGEDMSEVDSQHSTLLDFANWWTSH